MGTSNRNRGLWVLGVALGMVVTANAAWANTNIQESGSVLIFAKVLANGERDTLIEITNTGNSVAHAKCYYVNSSRPGQWSVMDFEIWLTKQQPTQWLVSRGRRVDIFDDFASPGAGFDPGRVPPVPSGFEGELKCVQVDQSGSPLRANKLIGKATLIRTSDADVATYNATALKGNPDAGIGNNDNVLELNNTAAGLGEYDGCPVIQTVSVFSEIADDPIIEDLGTLGCAPDCLSTTLTFVPCNQNLELARPSQVILNIFTYDEFEVARSTTILVDCWFNERLDSPVFSGVFNRDTLGVYARLIPATGAGRVVGIGEELRTSGDSIPTSAWAAFNLHAEGTRVCSDLTPGGRAGLACSSDADCPLGFCIDGRADEITIPLFDFLN